MKYILSVGMIIIVIIAMFLIAGCTSRQPVLKNGSCPAGCVKILNEMDFGFSTPYCDCSARHKFLTIYKETQHRLATAEPMLCRKNEGYYEDCELIEKQ